MSPDQYANGLVRRSVQPSPPPRGDEGDPDHVVLLLPGDLQDVATLTVKHDRQVPREVFGWNPF